MILLDQRQGLPGHHIDHFDEPHHLDRAVHIAHEENQIRDHQQHGDQSGKERNELAALDRGFPDREVLHQKRVAEGGDEEGEGQLDDPVAHEKSHHPGRKLPAAHLQGDQGDAENHAEEGQDGRTDGGDHGLAGFRQIVQTGRRRL